MTNRYINSAAVQLIGKLGYTTIKDQNDLPYHEKGIEILVASIHSSFYIVELLDGDMLSTAEIKERLMINQSRIKDMKGADSYHLFEVFIFNNQIDMEKLQEIKEGQHNEIFSKKYLSCLTVTLEDKQVIRHFNIPKTAGPLTRILNEALQSDYKGVTEYTDLDELAVRMQKESTIHFKTQKSPFTIGLIAVNVAVWVGMMAYSTMKGIDFNTVLSLFGAKENLSILKGEYWRFLTPVFLHASFMHLLINSYSLYFVGMISERLYGYKKFLFIYFSAGIFGNILSFIFSPNPGVGASGAIFGLLGALLYFGVESPALFKKYFGYNVIITVVINIAYGFSQPGIDNFAHMGGLLGGFLTSGIVKLNETSKKWLTRPIFIVATVLTLSLSLFYGFTNAQNTSLIKLESLTQLNEKESYAEAKEVGLEILEKNPKNENIRFQALWELVVAEASLGQYKSAFIHAEEIMKIDESRGYYIRGLLYYDTGNESLARADLEKAKAIDPDLAEAVDKLLKEL